MNFIATKWIERNYKIVAALMVVLATCICCIVFFSSVSEKSGEASFIISLFYALFLYVVGVFTNIMSERISSSLRKKAQIYINLKKVNELFESFDNQVTVFRTEKIQDRMDELYSNIVSFNCFTGHTDEPYINANSYIKDLGVTYNEEFLKTQKQFCEKTRSIVSKVNNELQNYIKRNEIKTRVPYPHFDLNYISNPALWCEEHIEGEIGDVIDFIYDIYGMHEEHFEEIRNLMVLLNDLFGKYKTDCIKCLNQIERMYGQKLIDFLEEEKWHFEDVDYIKRIVEEGNRDLSIKIEEIYDKLERVAEDCENIKDTLENTKDF